MCWLGNKQIAGQKVDAAKLTTSQINSLTESLFNHRINLSQRTVGVRGIPPISKRLCCFGRNVTGQGLTVKFFTTSAKRSSDRQSSGWRHATCHQCAGAIYRQLVANR